MDKPTFVYVTYIATTPEKLWEALTSGDFTRKYWGGRRVESEWRPGAPITYHYGRDRKVDIAGEVLRCEPPRVLSYTFGATPVDGTPREPASRVTFEIEDFGAHAVKLTLTHDEFPPNSTVYAGVSQGWPGILSNLKSVLEVGRSIFSGEWESCSAA